MTPGPVETLTISITGLAPSPGLTRGRTHSPGPAWGTETGPIRRVTSAPILTEAFVGAGGTVGARGTAVFTSEDIEK